MIKKIDSWIDKFSFYTLIGCLAGMLLISVASIVLRWMQVAFLWTDPVVRHLVFISAFLGGSLATGRNNHIRIDLAAKLFERLGSKYKDILNRILNFISAAGCFALAKAGYDFGITELEVGSEAFLGIHTGFLIFIIPAGMGIIGLRFFLRVLANFEEGAK